ERLQLAEVEAAFRLGGLTAAREAAHHRGEVGEGALRRLADHRVGEQRGGGHGDGAARALEARVLDASVLVHAEVHPELVAAQRVDAFRAVRRSLDAAEMPRVAGVIEDQLAVQLAQIVRQAAHENTSFAFQSAATRRSTSSRSL